MPKPLVYNQLNKDRIQDDRVLNFIKQIVLEKHGPNISEDFLTKEAGILYNKFSENIVTFFEPFIPNESKDRLDVLLKKSTDRDTILTFLMESIDNFELKIVQVLVDFRNSYLKAENS